MSLQNKIDFAVIFTVKNANPNGDPLGGNRPRTTSEGLGEVSDVCLKRKIRNRLQDMGEEIFVQMDSKNKDGFESLLKRYENFLPKKDQKSDFEGKAECHKKVCEKWFDVRSFGQVFAFKKDKDSEKGEKGVSLGVRGPVTIQSAFTKNEVDITSFSITKSVNGNEPKKEGEKSSDTMGMKHRVNHATYITYGSISPQLAEKTGFTIEDANKIKEALKTLFEGDESSARPSGSMNIKQIVWFEHSSKSGQYSSAKVHNSVQVDDNGDIIVTPLDGLVPEIIEGEM